MEETKPLFAHLDSAEHKAYRTQMEGCADLVPELFYNQASYLLAERAFQIYVSCTYELEAIYELYYELKIPVPEKFQRELAEEERDAWYERARTAYRKCGDMFRVKQVLFNLINIYSTLFFLILLYRIIIAKTSGTKKNKVE